jgi:transcriptional accessory protein Tex/SPT6
MGLDPGFRSGVKVAVVDATGKVVATTRSIRTSRAALGRALATLASSRWRTAST